MGSQGKQAELQEEGKMCGPPCFRSVCGFPLQKAVYIIGLVELTITVIVTIANVVKYSKNVTEDGEFCEGKDVCIGPIIKHCVFDAFFGIICSILLFIGARMRHRCLLIFWILITLGCSIKFLYVFFVSDWTSLEDWVSISYLAFYTAVTLVVVPSPRSAGPPRVALSMTMEHRQHTKLEKIFYNFFTICQSYISCLLKFSKYTKQN